MAFVDLLKRELILQSSNYYSDNFDYYRKGKEKTRKKVINLFKKLFYTPVFFIPLFQINVVYRELFLGSLYKMNGYMDDLNVFYKLLEDEKSKQLLLKLIAFRILGYVKVKLPLNSPDYFNSLKEFEKIKDENDIIELNFPPYKLQLHDLHSYNFNFKLYFTSSLTFCTIVKEHYRYQSNQIDIAVVNQDVVLDLGGCYGDTALYFAEKVGKNGKVYSFEFIPSNIEVFRKNMNINPHLKDRVEIVNQPLWNEANKTIYFKEKGGASRVSFEKFDGFDGETTTTTLDEFNIKKGLEKVDFIKSDIEGAEPFVLEGAVELLKKFQPKLAISIYHSMDDFTGIVKFINQLGLGYKFYLGHASIYSSETVLFCTCE